MKKLQYAHATRDTYYGNTKFKNMNYKHVCRVIGQIKYFVWDRKQQPYFNNNLYGYPIFSMLQRAWDQFYRVRYNNNEHTYEYAEKLINDAFDKCKTKTWD